LARPRRQAADLLGLAAFVAIPLVVAALGATATASSVGSWYAGLSKPPFSPPNAIFGPVWTVLYVLMGVAAWRVWRAAGSLRAAQGPLTLWGVQLALNLGWSFVFFGLRSPGWALVEIAALLAAIAVTAGAFWRRDRLAGLLFAPYLAWVAFASVLNFAIWRLN